MKFITDFSEINRSSFIEFLHEIDEDFEPNLSKKIKFDDYFLKVSEKAKVISILNGQTIIGLMIYYDNLEFSQITLLAIAHNYRGEGLSKKMFDIYFSINSKPTRIITWLGNDIARKAYLKLGFIEKEINKNGYDIEEMVMEKK